MSSRSTPPMMGSPAESRIARIKRPCGPQEAKVAPTLFHQRRMSLISVYLLCLLGFAEHFEQPVLIAHGNAELARLRQFGSGVFSCNDEAGAFADRSGDFAAAFFDELLRLFPLKAGKRACEHK